MNQSRKDLRGRALRKGEVQRKSDGRYMYTWTDPLGKRRFIYAQDLTELREKEKQLARDQMDGLDLYAAGIATVDMTFDRYMKLKPQLRETTRCNYLYMWDRFVRDTFGKKLVSTIKYSDVLQFYQYMINELKLSVSCVGTIHTMLHPTLQLAVRDGIIRINPSDGVMKELKSSTNNESGMRHALTIEQQRAFMNYIAGHPVYSHWWPFMAVMLGTGLRIGEAIGLRWADLDFEKRTINVNHSLVYYPVGDNRRSVIQLSKPKTEAGIRVVPMLDTVYDAFQMVKDEQRETGENLTEIDGMSGFVFMNRFGNVPNPQTVNRTIVRIYTAYNAEEILAAKREKREPLLIPHFSCHHLRHTFATRLCENETNLKVIQSVMGHRNIETTMDVYAEATERRTQETFDNLNKLDVF